MEQRVIALWIVEIARAWMISTETKMSSIWRNFNHWLHWKLSFWQLPVQPVMKISSKWRHFRFSASLSMRDYEILPIKSRASMFDKSSYTAIGRYSIKSSDNWQYHVSITYNAITLHHATIRIDCYQAILWKMTPEFFIYTRLCHVRLVT